MIRRSYEYLDVEMIELFFIFVMRQNLEFGNAVWSPIPAEDKSLVQIFIIRSTRIIPRLNVMYYEETLKIMKPPCLYYRSLRGDLIDEYKYTNGSNEFS
jgi:hypothetical protein